MVNSTLLSKPVSFGGVTFDPIWLLLEVVGDILCVMLALYVGNAGMSKLVPFHEGYSSSRKGFFYLASRWGIGNYPHLFRTIVGILEICIFLGCMLCFLPTPGTQLVVCMSLVAGIGISIAFLVNHLSDSKKWSVLRNLIQTCIALRIRVHQDLPDSAMASLKIFGLVTFFGLVFMLFRRSRYGKVPDPLLG
jgi:hypothetical protein